MKEIIMISIMLILIGITSGLVGLVAYVGVKEIWYVKPYCLRHGYTSHSITILGYAYCVKRVDQTDIVIPIEEIKE